VPFFIVNVFQTKLRFFIMNKYMFSFLLTMTTTVFSAEDRALAVQASKVVIAAARQVRVAGGAPAVAASVSDALMGRRVAELADDDLKKSTVTAAAEPAWVELFNKFRSVMYPKKEDQAEGAAAVAASVSDALTGTVVAPLQARGVLSEDARARYIAQTDGFLGAVEEMDQKSDLFAQLNFKVLYLLDVLNHCPILESALLASLRHKIVDMKKGKPNENYRICKDIEELTPEELRKLADKLEALMLIFKIENDKNRMERQQNLEELVLAAESSLRLKAELKHLLEQTAREDYKLMKEIEQPVADGAAAQAKS
jgi:hypothetical protein